MIGAFSGTSNFLCVKKKDLRLLISLFGSLDEVAEEVSTIDGNDDGFKSAILTRRFHLHALRYPYAAGL